MASPIAHIVTPGANIIIHAKEISIIPSYSAQIIISIFLLWFLFSGFCISAYIYFWITNIYKVDVYNTVSSMNSKPTQFIKISINLF